MGGRCSRRFKPQGSLQTSEPDPANSHSSDRCGTIADPLAVEDPANSGAHGIRLRRSTRMRHRHLLWIIEHGSPQAIVGQDSRDLPAQIFRKRRRSTQVRPYGYPIAPEPSRRLRSARLRIDPPSRTRTGGRRAGRSRQPFRYLLVVQGLWGGSPYSAPDSFVPQFPRWPRADSAPSRKTQTGSPRDVRRQPRAHSRRLL